MRRSSSGIIGRVREVLVSWPYAGGVAAVVRDDRGVWLTEALDDGHGTGLEDRPERIGLAPDGVVLGGRLPEGAARAVVLDPRGPEVEARCGGGAWVAVLPDVELLLDAPVRFETAAGDVVRPALPADWRRKAVPDADEPCAACAATAWELVTPTDASRGMQSRDGGPEEPSPVLVCGRCGHEEEMGVWYAPFDPDAEPDPVAVAEAERYRRERVREQLERLSDAAVPVYAIRGGPEPRTLGSWSTGDRSMSVTVRNGDRAGSWVEVETLHGRRRPEAIRWTLFDALLRPDDPPRASTPAVALWLRGREREQHAHAATAAPFGIELTVDGAPVPFEGLRTGDVWALAGETGDARITVIARGVAPDGIELGRLADPVAELAA